MLNMQSESKEDFASIQEDAASTKDDGASVEEHHLDPEKQDSSDGYNPEFDKRDMRRLGRRQELKVAFAYINSDMTTC